MKIIIIVLIVLVVLSLISLFLEDTDKNATLKIYVQEGTEIYIYKLKKYLYDDIEKTYYNDIFLNDLNVDKDDFYLFLLSKLVEKGDCTKEKYKGDEEDGRR